MKNKLQQWIYDPKRSYAEGVDLYLKTRTDTKFDKFFQSITSPAESSLHYKMLFQKISNIFRIECAKQQPSLPVQTVKVDISKAKPIDVDPIVLKKKDTDKKAAKIDANPYIRIEDLPANLKEMYEKDIQPRAKEIAHFHEVSKTAKTDKERKEAVNKAAELEDIQAAAWKVLDDYVNNKDNAENAVKDPAATVPNGNDAKEAVKLQSRIDDIKTNINRAVKELSSLKDEKKIASRNKSIEKWNSELEEKQARLKEISGE